MRWHRRPADPTTLRTEPACEAEAALVAAANTATTHARHRVAARLGGYALPSLDATDGEVLSILALAPSFAAALATERTFDRYVESHESTEPYLAAVPGEGTNGRVPPAPVIWPSSATAERPSILAAGLAAELAAGRTFIVHRIDQYDRGALRGLVEDLERIAGIPVGANCYLSRDGAEGFGRHWDDHDVIVLQVHGRKLWEVCRPTHLSPKRGYVHDELAGDPVWSGILEPGQALFIPRGWAHSVIGLDETSVHYTVGLHRPSFLEVVDALAWTLPDGADLGADRQGFRAWLEEGVGDGGARCREALAVVRGEVPTRPHVGLLDAERWLRSDAPVDELDVLWTGAPVFAAPPAATVTLRWSGMDVELDLQEAALLTTWPPTDPGARQLGADLLRAGLARVAGGRTDEVPA